MAGNNRLYYAIKQIGIKPDADAGDYDIVFGAQDISVSTNFNLTQIFEIGQLEIYQSLEELPDVEITVNKIFDGKPLIWHIATQNASAGPTLANRSNEQCIAALSLFPDTNDSATGTPIAIMESSGLFPRTLNYNFGVDGAFTESVTFVGNDKIYSNDNRILNTAAAGRAASLSFDGGFTNNNDTPSGIERREGLLFTPVDGAGGTDANGVVRDSDVTVLPQEIDGISSSGTNDQVLGDFNAHIQSISISTDLGRESLNELGRRGPYHRFATFPTEVTCSIEAIATSGDNVSATEEGIYTTGTDCATAASNLQDRTIRLATCGGVRIYLGTKNRLNSVDFGGGTTDGGNDTNTYNFTNFNSLTVMAEYDPNPNAATWWASRDTYLLD